MVIGGGWTVGYYATLINVSPDDLIPACNDDGATSYPLWRKVVPASREHVMSGKVLLSDLKDTNQEFLQ
jgi:hypothetical protein